MQSAGLANSDPPPLHTLAALDVRKHGAVYLCLPIVGPMSVALHLVPVGLGRRSTRVSLRPGSDIATASSGTD